jgi:hypothetical protein
VSTPRQGDVGRRSVQQRRQKLGFDEVETSAWVHFESVTLALHSVVNRGLLQHHRLSLADVQLLAHLNNRGPSQMGSLA